MQIHKYSIEGGSYGYIFTPDGKPMFSDPTVMYCSQSKKVLRIDNSARPETNEVNFLLQALTVCAGLTTGEITDQMVEGPDSHNPDLVPAKVISTRNGMTLNLVTK